jgi:hypothetical protein
MLSDVPRSSVLDLSSVTTGRGTGTNMASFDIATLIKIWRTTVEGELQIEEPFMC